MTNYYPWIPIPIIPSFLLVTINGQSAALAQNSVSVQSAARRNGLCNVRDHQKPSPAIRKQHPPPSSQHRPPVRPVFGCCHFLFSCYGHSPFTTANDVVMRPAGESSRELLLSSFSARFKVMGVLRDVRGNRFIAGVRLSKGTARVLAFLFWLIV